MEYISSVRLELFQERKVFFYTLESLEIFSAAHVTFRVISTGQQLNVSEPRNAQPQNGLFCLLILKVA